MCISPIILRNRQIRAKGNIWNVPVPCGKCPDCVKSKVNAWSFRIEKEMERSSSPFFITLTYNDENVPKSEKGLLTLCKRDIQLYFKRLRKAYGKKCKQQGRVAPKITYYLCGEYGSKTHRPHYHAILFNCDDVDLINSCWGLGFTYTPPVKNGAIGYVLKYISKKRDKRHADDDREREFSLMSKGIGHNYLSDAIRVYHYANTENCYITLKGGVKMAIPKYYKDKLYDSVTRHEVSLYLQQRAEELTHKQLRKIVKKNVNKNPLTQLELNKYSKTFDKRRGEFL